MAPLRGRGFQDDLTMLPRRQRPGVALAPVHQSPVKGFLFFCPLGCKRHKRGQEWDEEIHAGGGGVMGHLTPCDHGSQVEDGIFSPAQIHGVTPHPDPESQWNDAAKEDECWTSQSH